MNCADTLQILSVKQKATIQVDPTAHRIFIQACKEMPQTPPMGRVASGLVKWFARQPEAVKTAVISGVDEGLEIPYALALERVAKELRDRAAGVRPIQNVIVKRKQPERAEPEPQPATPRR